MSNFEENIEEFEYLLENGFCNPKAKEFRENVVEYALKKDMIPLTNRQRQNFPMLRTDKYLDKFVINELFLTYLTNWIKLKEGDVINDAKAFGTPIEKILKNNLLFTKRKKDGSSIWYNKNLFIFSILIGIIIMLIGIVISFIFPMEIIGYLITVFGLALDVVSAIYKHYNKEFIEREKDEDKNHSNSNTIDEWILAKEIWLDKFISYLRENKLPEAFRVINELYSTGEWGSDIKARIQVQFGVTIEMNDNKKRIVIEDFEHPNDIRLKLRRDNWGQSWGKYDRNNNKYRQFYWNEITMKPDPNTPKWYGQRKTKKCLIDHIASIKNEMHPQELLSDLNKHSNRNSALIK